MARELQAMAQTGSTYATDPYDISRYHRLAEIASDMMSRGSGIPSAVVPDLLGHEAGHPTPKVDVRAAVFRETDAADFFAVEALPPLSTMRVTESQIARLFRLHRDPCAPADFD
jgi:hypothetical protein